MHGCYVHSIAIQLQTKTVGRNWHRNNLLHTRCQSLRFLQFLLTLLNRFAWNVWPLTLYIFRHLRAPLRYMLSAKQKKKGFAHNMHWDSRTSNVVLVATRGIFILTKATLKWKLIPTTNMKPALPYPRTLLRNRIGGRGSANKMCLLMCIVLQFNWVLSCKNSKIAMCNLPGEWK